MEKVTMDQWLAAHNERVGGEQVNAAGKAEGQKVVNLSVVTDCKDIYERIALLRVQEKDATNGLLRVQFDIGVALREAKEQAGRGNWEKLFKSGTISMSLGAANRYMRLPNSFESFEDLLDAVGGGEDDFGTMNMTKVLKIIRKHDGNKKRGPQAGNEQDNTAAPPPPPKPSVEVDADIDFAALSEERGVLLEQARQDSEKQQREIDMLRAKLEQAENTRREDAKAAKKANRDNGRETLVKVVAERDALKAENKKLKARVNKLEADNANLIHLRAGNAMPPVLAVA